MSPFDVVAADSWAASNGFVEDFDNFFHRVLLLQGLGKGKLALRPYCLTLSSCISSLVSECSAFQHVNTIVFGFNVVTDVSFPRLAQLDKVPL